MKKRRILAAFLAGLLLAFTGCGGPKQGKAAEHQPNTRPGAELVLLEYSPGGAVYKIVNDTGKEIYTGNKDVISLEMEQEGVWYEIDVGERSFTAEAMIVPEGESGELETNWAGSYGTLPKGRYRLVKGFFEEDPNAAGFVLAAEFEIE